MFLHLHGIHSVVRYRVQADTFASTTTWIYFELSIFLFIAEENKRKLEGSVEEAE